MVTGIAALYLIFYYICKKNLKVSPDKYPVYFSVCRVRWRPGAVKIVSRVSGVAFPMDMLIGIDPAAVSKEGDNLVRTVAVHVAGKDLGEKAVIDRCILVDQTRLVFPGSLADMIEMSVYNPEDPVFFSIHQADPVDQANAITVPRL